MSFKTSENCPSADDKLMTQKELAHLLSVSTKFLEKHRGTGWGIPFVKLGDGPKAPVRYRATAVREYLDRHVRDSTSDPGPDSHRNSVKSGAGRAPARHPGEPQRDT